MKTYSYSEVKNFATERTSQVRYVDFMQPNWLPEGLEYTAFLRWCTAYGGTGQVTSQGVEHVL